MARSREVRLARRPEHATMVTDFAIVETDLPGLADGDVPVRGAVVIGTTGSDEKARWLRDDLGVDFAINYRTCGPLAGGRVALCGAIELYDSDNYRAGPANFFAVIEKCLELKGFNAGPYYPRAAGEIFPALIAMLKSGDLVWRETSRRGIEAAPQAFVDMMAGANFGKMVVTL
jgi:NADPH-dependent curcumin reductase CurA